MRLQEESKFNDGEIEDPSANARALRKEQLVAANTKAKAQLTAAKTRVAEDEKARETLDKAREALDEEQRKLLEESYRLVTTTRQHKSEWHEAGVARKKTARALDQFNNNPWESVAINMATRTTVDTPYDLTISANGAISKDNLEVDKTYHLLSADGKRALQASNTKSHRMVVLWDDLHFQGYTLAFGEDLQAPEASFSFSAGHTAGTHVLHSAEHGDNSLYFLGDTTCPREWVVWDKPGMKGDWEELELMWDDEKTFKIKGHEGQFVKWEEGGNGGRGGVFNASSEEEATKFTLREAGGGE